MWLITVRSESAEAFNGIQIVVLIRCAFGAEKQFGHANNAVHGCADFMAHVREKFAFGPG